jgi:GTP pyrophosphokinase
MYDGLAIEGSEAMRAQPVHLTKRFTDAVTLAMTLHANDLRKGTTIPYSAHLLGVCALVLADGGDEDEAIAALLHDALEDHGDAITAGEIEERFNARVARIVVGCSDTPPGFSGGPKPPWRERKDAYLAHLRVAEPDELRVSLADKLYNARAILADLRAHGASVWTRFTAGHDGQLWYYRALVDGFRDRGVTSPMFDELARIVAQIEDEP